MRTILKNGKVITPLRIIDGAGIMIINGIIEQILEEGQWEWLEGDEVIDVKGRYISPG
ncbi:MAG TPA: N-acetylglucosamine-6-phosphate deacetylase, partial [Clostridium sp.]|nr:N-acetylglucosamine-6-phosphate deacetylase [Clostridium sp.]